LAQADLLAQTLDDCLAVRSGLTFGTARTLLLTPSRQAPR